MQQVTADAYHRIRTFDARDVRYSSARYVTADAALPKAGGTMTGDFEHGQFIVRRITD